LSRVSPNPN